MKSLSFFLLLAIILVGCDECGTINPPIPPVVLKDSFIIKGIAHENGKISPSEMKVEKNYFATFNIIPNPGYEIDYLLDDGYKLPAIDIYTVKDVISNDTFEVFFKKDPIVWPLVNIVWKRDTTFSQGNDGIVWYYFQQNFTDSFYPDGKIINIYDGRTITTKYYLDKSNLTIKVGNITYKIELLTEKRMVLSWMMGVEKNWASYSNGGYKDLSGY